MKAARSSTAPGSLACAETSAPRHAQAFAALHAALGLDYFAIDCAELPDGRLLLFEADVAMILHAMDSETLYPYKRAPMLRLFAAFQAHLAQLAARRITPCSN